MKKIGIQAIFCIITLCTSTTMLPQTNFDKNLLQEQVDTDVDRTTEITVQTPWLYVKMLTDDPFVQVTVGLFIIAGILIAGHQLYTPTQ